MKRLISLLLCFLFFLQSCVVYQKMPVSISEAVRTKDKVKVITKEGNKGKFVRIEEVDGVYFGIWPKNNITIYPESIHEIYIKDIKKSKSRTWWMVGIGTPIVLFLGFTIYVLVELDKVGAL